VKQEHIHNELVPLSSAAATAYLALAGRGIHLSDGVLDVVAIALATCMPVYGAQFEDEPLRRLSDLELAGGKFSHGAARLQFANGRRAFTRLAVTTLDFAEGLARLKRAGVNFSHARFEPAPRRVPTVVPA